MPSTARGTLLPVCVGLGTALLFLPFAPLGVDTHHDGLMLKPAFDVRAGQMPFRDTFSQYGVLTPLVHAAALSLFGPRLLVLKLVTVAAYAVAAALLAATWRRMMPAWLVVLSVALWWLSAPFIGPRWIMLPWPSVIALCAQAASMLAFCRALESKTPTLWAFGCGIAAAVAQLARTPVGAAHTAAMGGAWLLLLVTGGDRRRAWTDLTAFAAAVILVHVACFAWLAHASALDPWYQQTIAWPGEWAGATVKSFPGMLRRLLPFDTLESHWDVVARQSALTPSSRWAIVLTTPAAVASIAPLTLLVGTVHALWASRGRLRDDSPTTLGVALAIPALAAWHQYLPINDPRHVFWGLAPLIGGFSWALWHLTRGRVAPTALLVAALLLPLAVGRADDVRAKTRAPLRPIEGVPVLAGMKAAPEVATAYEQVFAAVTRFTRKRPETALVLQGNDPLPATFVPNLRNWRPYFILWPGPPQDDAERRRFIATYQPLVLIDSRPAVWPEYAPIAAEVLERDYGYRTLYRGADSILMGPASSVARDTGG